jgi:hypothetical protein
MTEPTGQIMTVEAVRQEIAPIVEQAKSLEILTAEHFEDASRFLKSVKTAQKVASEFFAPMKKKAHDAWKAIKAKENETLAPLSEAEAMLKRKMLSYNREQEAIRREEQRKLQAKADADARKERERLEKLAASRKTPEKQEEYREAAAAIVAPVVEVAPVVPKVKGQTIRKTWKAEVVDVALVPREYMVVNQKALDAIARSTKGAITIPGVKFVATEQMASGRW